MAKTPMEPTKSVYPSGFEAATNLPPRPPLAPGLLSMMNVCPSDSWSLAETVRAVMSDEPPGVNGTTTVTGRSGYCWAASARGKTEAASPRARRARFMSGGGLLVVELAVVGEQRLCGTLDGGALLRVEVGDHRQHRTHVGDPRERHRVVQDADRAEGVALVLQRNVGCAHLFRFVIALCLEELEKARGTARGHAHRARREALQPEVAQVRDRRPLADAADDDRAIDVLHQLIEVCIL